MKIKSMFNSRVTAVVAGAAVVALLGTSAGFAASQIGSNDIKDNSIRSKDIRDRTIKSRDLRESLLTELRGGTAGPAGPVGPAGKTGPSGQADVTTYLTPPSTVPAFNRINVAEVPASPVNGSKDSDTTLLTFNLDKGKYLIDGTAQFFHFVPGQDSEDFGVVSLLVDGSSERGTAFTADIPNDGNNGAQTNANAYVVIPNDNTTLRVVGSIRGIRAGQAGAQVIATKVG